MWLVSWRICIIFEIDAANLYAFSPSIDLADGLGVWWWTIVLKIPGCYLETSVEELQELMSWTALSFFYSQNSKHWSLKSSWLYQLKCVCNSNNHSSVNWSQLQIHPLSQLGRLLTLSPPLCQFDLPRLSSKTLIHWNDSQHWSSWVLVPNSLPLLDWTCHLEMLRASFAFCWVTVDLERASSEELTYEKEDSLPFRVTLSHLVTQLNFPRHLGRKWSSISRNI